MLVLLLCDLSRARARDRIRIIRLMRFVRHNHMTLDIAIAEARRAGGFVVRSNAHNKVFALKL